MPIFSLWESDRVACLEKLGRAQYESLQEMTFHAIQGKAPELTFDEFLGLPITLPELVAAFPVIAEQTGIFSRGEPGEAVAGNALTGTQL